jgi:DNA polymerase/3'-5' exonuclease PolX
MQRVYTALMEHPEVIASGTQAGKIKYIGKSSVLKIDEFLATGQMEALTPSEHRRIRYILCNSLWCVYSMFNVQ